MTALTKWMSLAFALKQEYTWKEDCVVKSLVNEDCQPMWKSIRINYQIHLVDTRRDKYIYRDKCSTDTSLNKTRDKCKEDKGTEQAQT